MVEVKVAGIALDNITNMPIIILKDKNGRELPIWVGMFEAQAIIMALEGITPPRPMTHDLLKDVISSVGGEVEKVVITSLHNNTYYAKLVISINGTQKEIDSRPSDAIALALRVSSPIFVDASIKMFDPSLAKPIDDEEVERFKEQLKNLNPADFL